MKIKEIRKIANDIAKYKWVGSQRLDNLLIKMIEESNFYCNALKEQYIDHIADPKSKGHDRLFSELEVITKQNSDCPIFTLLEESDGYYIQRDILDDSELYEKAVNKVESFNDHGNKKGTWFEKFCIQFLIDFGITCKKTPPTNDKGIDIYGYYKSNINPQIGSLIRNDLIYVLGQAKYYNEKIDTPIIRKLVGDTMFIRFDDLEYIEIKHNAVHLVVFSKDGFTKPARKFAEKNKIELFDSIRIAHLIASNPTNNWLCLHVGN